MVYASVDYFIETVTSEEAIDLTNLDNPDATLVNKKVLERALAHATAEINAYLATRYLTPLTTPVPTVLAYKTVVIARYMLDRNRRRESVTDEYTLVISQLKDYAAGRAVLVNDDGSAVAPALAQGTQEFGNVGWGEGDRVFTEESLAGYLTDFKLGGRY